MELKRLLKETITAGKKQCGSCKYHNEDTADCPLHLYRDSEDSADTCEAFSKVKEEFVYELDN